MLCPGKAWRFLGIAVWLRGQNCNCEKYGLFGGGVRWAGGIGEEIWHLPGSEMGGKRISSMFHCGVCNDVPLP